MEIFDQLTEILAGESTTLKEYGRILEAGFEVCEVGVIPTTIDQVLGGIYMNKKLNLISVLLIIFIGTSVYFAYRHNNLQKQISEHYKSVYTTINSGIMEVREEIDLVNVENDNVDSQLSVQLGRVQELRFATTAFPDALEHKYSFLLKEIYNELYQVINTDENHAEKSNRLENIKNNFNILEEISGIVYEEKELRDRNSKFFLRELNSTNSQTALKIDEVFNKLISETS